MARIKVKDGENLSPSNIQRVIDELSKDKPITKKAACDMLNISYNTKRLSNIIEQYQEELEYRVKRKKELRRTPVSISEKKEIVQSYLEGESLTTIEESTYRSISVIKNILSMYGIPFRDAKHTYKNPPLLPEAFICKDYVPGDLVYSARYGAPAYVEKAKDDLRYEKIFRIRLVGKNRRQAVQPYYELSDLRPIQKTLGVVLYEMDDNEINYNIKLALMNARKKAKND